MFEFCICAVVPKLPGFLKFKGECIFAKQIGCIQMQCNFSPSPPGTAWFSSSLGSPAAPWSLRAQRCCAGWRPPLAFTLCENQSLSEACASVYRDSGTATSSVDWAAWSTAPGSATVGCGSTATQWVGVHAPPPPPSCGPFKVMSGLPAFSLRWPWAVTQEGWTRRYWGG